MSDDEVVSFASQRELSDPLSELLREKAVELLQAAVNAECAQFLSRFADQRDASGRLAVVRNGYRPERSILTGIGALPVKVPRVRDRLDQDVRFDSKLVFDCLGEVIRGVKFVDAIRDQPTLQQHQAAA